MSARIKFCMCKEGCVVDFVSRWLHWVLTVLMLFKALIFVCLAALLQEVRHRVFTYISLLPPDQAAIYDQHLLYRLEVRLPWTQRIARVAGRGIFFAQDQFIGKLLTDQHGEAVLWDVLGRPHQSAFLECLSFVEDLWLTCDTRDPVDLHKELSFFSSGRDG